LLQSITNFIFNKMKKILFSLILVVCAFSLFGQTNITRDVIKANQLITLKIGGYMDFAGYGIHGISNDTTLAAASTIKLVTENAVKKAIDAATSGVSASFVSGDSIFLVTPSGDTIFTGSSIVVTGDFVTVETLDDSLTVLRDSINALRADLDALGGGASVNQVTLTGSGETSLRLRYFGSGTPTFVKTAAGNFTLTFPAGTMPASFHWSGNNTNLDGSNAINILIVSADGNNEFFDVAIRAASSGNLITNLTALGVTVDEDVPVAGSVQSKLTNMNGFGASGFVIIANF
jgi:hypothetical protein